MTYILILFVLRYNAMTSQAIEFETREACQAAYTVLYEEIKATHTGQVIGACYPKGDG